MLKFSVAVFPGIFGSQAFLLARLYQQSSINSADMVLGFLLFYFNLARVARFHLKPDSGQAWQLTKRTLIIRIQALHRTAQSWITFVILGEHLLLPNDSNIG